MKHSEIRSYRTALAYLAHGDDRAKRWRLALILACTALGWAMVIAATIYMALVVL